MKKFIFITLLNTLWMGHALAGLTLNTTRIVFNGSDKVETVSVTSQNSTPILLQSWIEDADGQKIQAPITALPPLQRINAGQTKQVKFTTLGNVDNLAQDKETLFYYNALEVPPVAESGANEMKLIMQARVKLFYRPKAIVKMAEEKWWQKQVKLIPAGKNNYVIKNPTPFHVVIIPVVDGFNAKEILLKPNGEEKYAYPMAADKLVKVGFIDDFGGFEIMKFICEDTCRLEQQEAQ